MDGCIFCSIITGDTPSDIFYEDDHFIAFLDIRPHTKGHSLLVPKLHSTSMLEAGTDIQNLLGPTCVRVGTLLRETLSAPGLNIISNIGSEAGQIIFHTHIHLIPRPDNNHSHAYTYADNEKAELLTTLRAASGYKK